MANKRALKFDGNSKMTGMLQHRLKLGVIGLDGELLDILGCNITVAAKTRAGKSCIIAGYLANITRKNDDINK